VEEREEFHGAKEREGRGALGRGRGTERDGAARGRGWS